MPVVALSGQLRAPLCAFAIHDIALWWWGSLRTLCPSVVAAVVVPHGFWLVAATEDPTALFRSVVARASRLTTRLGAPRPVWRPIASPRIAQGTAGARAWARAVLQQPCALGLANDALAWRWSTARDLAGAVCDPWVDRSGWVAAVLGERGPTRQGLAHVVAGARPSPAPLAAVAMAAADATRGTPQAIDRPGATRNVFVWLGRAEGWDFAALAQMCSATTCVIRTIADEPNLAWQTAAARCLHDPRLRAGAWAPRVA